MSLENPTDPHVAAWLALTDEQRAERRARVHAQCIAQGVDPLGTPEQGRITAAIIRRSRELREAS